MAKRRTIRTQVRDRARNRCEYCRMPAEFDSADFQVDHVRPQKHRGATKLENLAWACFPCNNHKGPNLTGIDPQTDSIAAVYDPRTQAWTEHFEWDGPELVGLTPTGRATIAVMEINDASRVALRKELMFEGVFPPPGDQFEA